MNSKKILVLLFICFIGKLKAQEVDPNLKTKGYFSIVHPIFTTDANGVVYNFDHQYTVAFQWGSIY